MYKVKTFILTFVVFVGGATATFCQQNNLAVLGEVEASTDEEGEQVSQVIDGLKASGNGWKISGNEEASWIMVRLPGATEISTLMVAFDSFQTPLTSFKIQVMHNGQWRDIKNVTENDAFTVRVNPEKPILADRIRLYTEEKSEAVISEIEIYGQEYVDSSVEEVPRILVNQSGYNLHRTKRFSMPSAEEGTRFHVKSNSDDKVLYSGEINAGIGDITDFEPRSSEEFYIESAEERSYPFRIGINWLERISYRNMVDFMIGARHYVGTTDQIRPLSWAWRDGDFFNWAEQSLVTMFLANPSVFKDMEQTIRYVPNSDFDDKYLGKWGKLLPYDENTPDLVQLIHWDADVKISQQLEHEMQKCELAYFLYAWPYLEGWLPRQNFEVVYDYLKEKWTKSEVGDYSTTKYDQSTDHNLLSLKTSIGTTKGEMPPGYSVIPNLMMYEVAKDQGEQDADKYFHAAYQQMEWLIEYLDWQDPMVTKGQRMSEHVTMRAFAYFYHEYPDRAPKGLHKKVEEWAKVALARSDNYWDFRKYSEKEWTPPSWNETGNVLGFPAAALSAMSILEDNELIAELEILVWSHFDNAFGRNPTGRHFSYNGPEEIEGVDKGWYSMHKGGIGLLEEVKFVFDGSPKSFHYPNHPEVGNLGWTEGWVQFNTAYNLSMAYLAKYYSSVNLLQQKNQIIVSLKAPVNFHQEKRETAAVRLTNEQGQSIVVTVTEHDPYMDELKTNLRIKKGMLKIGDQKLPVRKGGKLTASYGYGFMQSENSLTVQ
ncbi:discoidin domain-containing protein [Echinicola marina]|uniref:discoidin domain-containing protein n=1 Tax=Echinicola marina TaxID=2859768 RepID=UPI001CF6A1A7|nr:discoidin domain-containing protein [Echinicola marina]UCS92080.1 discoidin domain-containing protein [Echinicola marina]